MAVAIFSVVTSAVYTVFRTGMRAYEVGMRTGELMQTGRFAMDIVSRDFKNIFLIAETDYNIQYNRRRQALEEERLRVEKDFGNPDELAKKVEDFNLGSIGLDLRFRAAGSADAAEVSFVRYQGRAGARAVQPMNLARVSYYVEDQSLMRSEEDVFRPDLDPSGVEMERPAAQPERLIRKVKSFSIRYGFYYDGQWLETLSWESASQQYRTDAVDLEWEDTDIRTPLEQQIGSWRSRQADDNLPSYVRVKLVVDDPLQKGRPRTFERTINLPNAQDSHLPLPDEMKLNDPKGKEHLVRRNDILQRPRAQRRSERFGLETEEERPRIGEAAEFYLE